MSSSSSSSSLDNVEQRQEHDQLDLVESEAAVVVAAADYSPRTTTTSSTKKNHDESTWNLIHYHRRYGTAMIDYSMAEEYVSEHYEIDHYFGSGDGMESQPSPIRRENIYDARKGIIVDDEPTKGLEQQQLQRKKPRLDDCGFELFKAPTQVSDFRNLTELKQIYEPELIHELIPNALGLKVADKDHIEKTEETTDSHPIVAIHLWHPVLRGEEVTLEPRTDHQSASSPVASMVHIDTDVGAYGVEGVCNLVDKNRLLSKALETATTMMSNATSGPLQKSSKVGDNDLHVEGNSVYDDLLKILLQDGNDNDHDDDKGNHYESMADQYQGYRVMLLNIWRPLVPVTSSPLGILATRYDKSDNVDGNDNHDAMSEFSAFSSSTENDTINGTTAAMTTPHGIFPTAVPNVNTSRWYIYSNMQPDECLIFKQYDRRLDKISDLWHCALPTLEVDTDDSNNCNDPTNKSDAHPHGGVPRMSFDIKAMVILREEVPYHLDRFNAAVRPRLTLEESGTFCNAQAAAVKASRQQQEEQQ